MKTNYDIVIVGAGHAGVEAANASAKMGAKVLLVTMDLNKIAQMSCNPAVGGIAKGQIVREIDALGGLIGKVTDASTIQFRMLNTSKGPAMWSPRAQCDRASFSNLWREEIENIKNIDLLQDIVIDIIIENKKIKAVKTQFGFTINCKSLILTNGTFLNGLIHIGKNKISGGRISELPSNYLSEKLKNYGIEYGRMKTGTSPRLDGRTVDFDKMIEQKGDANPDKFSFYYDRKLSKQLSCYITYTNEEVHAELRKGFKDSPLFTGRIKGIGPRYCPSIEDKLKTFEGRDKHQLFIEPEGLQTKEYYINGFTTSLPLEVQIKALRKINGLENVKIFKPGYAIEYDYFLSTQLEHSLETKQVKNLYFAGQINGTTGYEEAAAQGLMAGINAQLKLQGKDAFILDRDEAYIGVLIDDLITKGVDEPYRMFTSRAEYRVLLRQDNVDIRLAEKGYNIGLLDEEKYKKVQNKKQELKDTIKFIRNLSVSPSDINEYLLSVGTDKIKQKTKLANIIKRPQISLFDLLNKVKAVNVPCETSKIIHLSEIEIKYEGYISREKDTVAKAKKKENVKISDKINYDELKFLSTEARQKLENVKPRTIGQASRISGVSPSDISGLIIYIGR